MTLNWRWTLGLGLVTALAAGLGAPSALKAQQSGSAGTRGHLYKGHRADSAAQLRELPSRRRRRARCRMTTYEEVRPWARAIKQRTGIGPHAGVMPPWYMEKNIGIQKYKDDPSLSAAEVATVAKWADSGAPRGNPADMPPAKQ